MASRRYQKPEEILAILNDLPEDESGGSGDETFPDSDDSEYIVEPDEESSSFEESDPLADENVFPAQSTLARGHSKKGNYKIFCLYRFEVMRLFQHNARVASSNCGIIVSVLCDRMYWYSFEIRYEVAFQRYEDLIMYTKYHVPRRQNISFRTLSFAAFILNMFYET